MTLILLPPLLILLFASAGVRRVPEGVVVTVHRFGNYNRILTPGLHFILPLADRLSSRVQMVGHRIAVPVDPEGQLRAAIYYQILEPERVGGVLDRIDTVVMHKADRVLAELRDGLDEDGLRPELAEGLKRELNSGLETLGLRVTRCNLLPQTSN